MARTHKTDDEEHSYWQSYSDMMAALLLIFVLIISFTMLQMKKQYEEKQALIDEQQQVMDEQKEKIEEIVGVKTDIISELKAEFENMDLAITVDGKTGAITFDSDLLFDPNSSTLKDSSKQFLQSFLPKYFSLLLNDDFKDNIAEIIIEGHTAQFGTYMDCLSFSQARALAVAQYSLSDESGLKNVVDMNVLQKLITVNGRGYSDPVYDANGNIDEEKSRRVEIKFRLKDEDMVSEMLGILGQEETTAPD